MNGAPTYLEVTTLGRFEVRRDQEPLAGGNWNRRKVNELFKLLLTAEQHRLHREQIQELLWPSFTSEQAANSFGKTLYLLRRALEPELAPGRSNPSTYITLDHDTLTLVVDMVRVDADIFEASIKQLQIKTRSHSTKERTVQETAALLDEYDRTLTLYGGDYLPEDLYEDWTQRRRDRLRRFHSWLLENAAELAIGSTLGLRACEYLQALLERNPADEQTHRRLMVVYARMGRRSDALNQYQFLREALRTELRANPLPETVELHRTIQAGRIMVDLAETSYGMLSNSPAPALEQADRSVRSLEPETPPPVQQPVEPSVSTVIPPELKGRGQLQEQAETAPAALLLNTTLVGRAEEMRRLQLSCAESPSGRSRALFISGEPGIGKTRLGREFSAWLEAEPRGVVLWGYCYEMSGSLPYQPIADAISAHIRTSSPDALRLALGSSAVDLAKIVPEIRSKLPDLPLPEPLGPELERRNLYAAVAHYFSSLASLGPVTLILDDLQWADTATIQLLGFLTSQSARAGLPQDAPLPFFLLLYRADEVHESHPLRELLASLLRTGVAEELRLMRLGESDVMQLLKNLAKQDVRPVFAAEIYKYTEGNPFFIGEAVRALVEEGKIKRVGERWQMMVGVDQMALPQSLRLLIERRLVHLSPEARMTLGIAAVLGRQFDSALLVQAHRLSEDIVAEHIDDAIRAQILAPISVFGPKAGLHASVQEADLAFTHDKIREVLYQSLNPLRRRAIHRQVAQAIETRYASRLQPHYASLANHYRAAEDAARAADYFALASRHAASVYAFVDAAAYMEQALELLIGDEELTRRAELLRPLAETYLYIGRPDKAIEAGESVGDLWCDLGDAGKEAEARLDVGFAFHWMGREPEAVRCIQRALECLRAQPPDEVRLRAKAYAQWGLAATNMGDTAVALAHLERAETLHAQCSNEDPFITVVTLWSRSWCAFLTASPLQMLDYAERSAAACRSWRLHGWEPMMTYTVAWAQMLLGRLKESEETARDTLEKAQRHNVVGAQGWSYLVQAFLATQTSRWEQAALLADQADAIAVLLHDLDLRARVLWSRSVCAGWRGDWQEAIRTICEALQETESVGASLMMYPYFLLQAANAYFYAGKLEEADSYLEQAMRMGQERQYRQLPALGMRLLGRMLVAQGKFEAALPCFEQALTDLAALDDALEHTRTLEAYGLFYLARNRPGDSVRGMELLDTARATFKRLGVTG